MVLGPNFRVTFFYFIDLYRSLHFYDDISASKNGRHFIA